MVRLCLSCTVTFHGPYRALNLYGYFSWWVWSLGCFHIVSDSFLSFRFYLSTWKHVLMPVDLLFVPLGLIYCRCHHFYATVKRPAVFPHVHTPMYLTYFGVICPMCVIPTNGEPRLKNQIKTLPTFWIYFLGAILYTTLCNNFNKESTTKTIKCA